MADGGRRKYLLIDGNSLTYRAFFALPTDLATASGQVTNAVYGFTSMLLNLLRDHRPDGVAVAFDRPEPTFRHERLDDYKAGRQAAPDILRQQMGLVRQVVEVLGLPLLEQPGFEADDIIATLATQIRDRNEDVIVVTGDRDAYQLVEDPHVKVLYNKRGVSDYALYDEAGILERTGVTPEKYVDYAALRGDKSDNLPGVPGVGEKTAAKLINKYGDALAVLDHADDQTPKLATNLTEHAEQVRTNKEVMVLVRDMPLEVALDELRMDDFDEDEVKRLFEFLEFQSLFDRVPDALGIDLTGTGTAGGADVLEAEVDDRSGDASQLLATLAKLEGELAVAGAWAGEPGRSELVGLAFVVDSDSAEVAWIDATSLDDGAAGHDALVSLFGPSGRPIVAHDAKALVRTLESNGVVVGEVGLDTAIAGYLLDPAESRYVLGDLLVRYAHLELPNHGAAQEGQLDLDGDSVAPSLTAARAALAVDRVAGPIREALGAQGLRELNDRVEVPLVRVLARMEAVGVGVDVEELTHLRDQLVADVERLRAAIYEAAGTEFNVNSTPQLREILFDKLGLTPQKKTKTGYSTDAATLEKLRDEHPVVAHLLEYREAEKLRSTYGEGLLQEVQPDGRIHATFNQTVARTGRLSSDAPNLHNIPVRSEAGRRFRKAFIPSVGFEFLVADYNQIELRCIAHLAEDPGLIEAFEAGQDIHNATASRIFDVAPADVDAGQRSKAKMVSYGLAYGMEAYGLGQRLNIPTGEAAEILEAYFVAFPAVKSYMDATVAEARERGYTETLFGRRRQIPELSSRNPRIRQAGERQAMNAGIQGLAADIFKVALVDIDDRLATAELRSRLILQVHDEVILEVPPEERETATDLVTDAMATAFDLRVPLEVNLAFGPTWADAKA